MRLLKGLVQFLKVLVVKQLINRHILVSAAKVGRLARLVSSSRTSGDAGDVWLLLDDAGGYRRQQSQGDGGGKTTRIGDLFGVLNLFFVDFRKTIHKTGGFIAENGAYVNHYGFCGKGMGFQKRFGLPMGQSKKNRIDPLRLHLVCKDKG